jgi:prefoldin subunit 5
MSKPRTMADIQNEYGRLCANAGQIQYQVSELNKDLALVNSTLRELNLEASKLKEAEAKAAAAPAAAPEVPA